MPSICLDGVGILEQLVELTLLCLELGVAANVLLADEDVGHGALLGDLLESVLDRGTVVCGRYVSDQVPGCWECGDDIPIWSSSRM